MTLIINHQIIKKSFKTEISAYSDRDKFMAAPEPSAATFSLKISISDMILRPLMFPSAAVILPSGFICFPINKSI